ncbi:Uncharacterised protein [Segatella copri]|nr:Uncharacterised protein [Segatella copri]
MSCNHIALAVVLILVNHTIWVLLDTVVWVLIVVTCCSIHFHGRRVIQTYPNRVRLILTETYTAILCAS